MDTYMGRCNLKAIAVSPENYERLKDLRRAGDNMNSIVTKLFEVYDKHNSARTQSFNPAIYEGEQS
jgi:hypothetical protein